MVPAEAYQAQDKGAEPSSLVAKVMDYVRATIREEGLRAGDVLPSEAEIAERAGVSRIVVREANRSLAALGLIDVGNGRRARVKAVDHEVLAVVIDHGVQTDQVSIQQILDVRRTVETRTVGLAALLRTDREARQITDAAARMRAQMSEPADTMEADIAFHEAVARASHNPMFALIVASFHVVTRQTWGIGWEVRRHDLSQDRSVTCHERIAEAIAARDRSRAEALMGEHFDDTVRVLHASGIN